MPPNYPDERGAALSGDADEVRRSAVAAAVGDVGGDPEPDEPNDRGEGPAEDADGEEAAGTEDDDDAEADAIDRAAHDGCQDEGAREAEETTEGGDGKPVRNHKTYRVNVVLSN